MDAKGKLEDGVADAEEMKDKEEEKERITLTTEAKLCIIITGGPN